jgi:membrane protein implicated in regulation of membrane protease activity
MNWEMFYLSCFLVGVALSVVAFVGGAVHIPHLNFHLSHGHAIPHVGGGHAAVGHGPEMPYINFGTITAFLAWFGGTGYLLTRHSGLLAAVIILLSTFAGLVASTIVFWFIVRFLLTHDQALDPADFDMVGVLGRVSSSIREGGTGEIVFSQNGTRHTCGARSDDGKGLARGTEVIVTRYERGIAYVRRYDEMAESETGEKSANK